MAKKEKRNFRIKMNNVCGNDELRPVMSAVYFNNGFMYATDAHVAIKAAVQHFSDFSQEEVETLNGKMIHKDTFAKILKCDMVTITEDGVQDLKTKDIYLFYKSETKYPNVETIITSNSIPVDQIGITPSVAAKLLKTLATTDIYNLRMIFSGNNKAIRFESNGVIEGALTAILMPCLLDPM